MNAQFQARVDDFLKSKHIAVAGYSRNNKMPANAIYKKMKNHGYEVFAVNPHASEITDVDAYNDLASIPGGADAVFICTPPDATIDLIREAAKLGINKVWIHRSVDGGSYVSGVESVALKAGIDLIPFGCPMMFIKPDVFHLCMKWIYQMGGKFKVPEKSAMAN